MAPRRASCSSPGAGRPTATGTSPLLPGTNGSGAQLALALQARGVGSIRFDKVGSGVNMPKSNAPADLKMLEVLSLAHYVDEAVAAFDELAERDAVRPDLPPRPQRRIDPRLVGGDREAGGPALRRLHQPVRAVALDPRHGDRTDPRDPPQSGRATRQSSTGARRLSQRDAEARCTDARPVRNPRGRWPSGRRRTRRIQQKVARELVFADPLAALPSLSRARPRGVRRERRARCRDPTRTGSSPRWEAPQRTRRG